MVGIDLKGKKGLILGVANQRSIAWAIAKILHEAGAELAFGYFGERLRPSLEKLTKTMGEPLLIEADITDDEENTAMFATLEKEFGILDFVIHSVAFTPKSTFEKPFHQITKEEWNITMEASAYSLVAVANKAAPLMKNGGSIITMSYLAAERVVPYYNMMAVAKSALEASMRYLAYEFGEKGIRVNAISAGALRTLSARSISGFGTLYSKGGDLSMFKRNITQDEVAGMALALISDRLGSGITGETIYVDAGYQAMGMFIEELEARL